MRRAVVGNKYHYSNRAYIPSLDYQMKRHPFRWCWLRYSFELMVHAVHSGRQVVNESDHVRNQAIVGLVI